MEEWLREDGRQIYEEGKIIRDGENEGRNVGGNVSEKRGRKRAGKWGGKEYDITAEDCGVPREMEYANEEEWPPNSRQVLYYFFALSSFCFRKRKRT